MWVFNVADACVCVGGAMLVLWLIMSTVSDYKKQKAAKSESTHNTDTAE
jgi:lipoprotein signal peptidase